MIDLTPSESRTRSVDPLVASGETMPFEQPPEDSDAMPTVSATDYVEAKDSEEEEVARSSASSSPQSFTKDASHRYIKTDGGALMSSMEFYHKYGWLAAPPISRRHRARVKEALRRHRIVAGQIRDALEIYVNHAKSVFKVDYASFMVASTNDAQMLVLAQTGGNPEVTEVARTVTLCSHAMVLPKGEAMVVNNTETDWRFQKCPSTITGSICHSAGRAMRFYASVPLFMSHALHAVESIVQVGRLCIMAEQPRPDFQEEDAQLLYNIATMATDVMEKEYQSRRNHKAAEMQKRTSSLIRSLEDTILEPRSAQLDGTSRSSASGSGSEGKSLQSDPSSRTSRYSTSVVDRACQQMKQCLGAAAVATFDVSKFRLSRFVSTPDNEASSSSLSPSAWTGKTSFRSLSNAGSFNSNQSGAKAGPTSAQTIHTASTDTPLRAFGLRDDSPPPILMSFHGSSRFKPNMTDNAEQCKKVFATALSKSANETSMTVRCKMYHRGQSEDGSVEDEPDDEEEDQELLARLERRDDDTWAGILPTEAQVRSYAVCVCYNRAKARPLLTFLIMFSEDVSFDQQDKYFVENCAQVSLTSLLRQRLTEVDFFQADFLRHVQHNMRTPLHGAMGAVDYLRGAIHGEDETASASIDLSPNGVLATMLESISLSGTTLSSYIDDLLSFQSLADIKPGVELAKLVTTDLVKLIENVANEEWELAQRLELQSQTLDDEAYSRGEGPLCGMELIIKASEDVRKSQWLAKPEFLTQIVRRVVSNAIRFTRRGYIEISLRVVNGSPHHASKSSKDEAHGSAVEIEVTDTGMGMTKEFAATELTKPFTKGDSFRDGIGLGMTIVSSTLQKLGGKLSVASEVNVGTKISMIIPLERSTTPHSNISSIPNTVAPRLATRKVAYHGMDTRGLRRLANSIWEHFLPNGGMEVTQDLAAADCIVLSERALPSLLEGSPPLLNQFKPDARFVLLPVAPVLRKPVGVEVLDGRAVIPFSLPHGPTALRLLETFLSEEDPLVINIRRPAHLRKQTEQEIAGSLRATAARHRSYPSDVSETILEEPETISEQSEPVPKKAVATIPARSSTSGSTTDQEEFRVLIVEDNPINMKLLTTLCKRLDIHFDQAHDGAEAVTKFVSFRPAVVLLDISLPIQDGFEACQQMRAHNHPSYIVAITALSSEEDKTRGIETCGMDSWITKPVSPRRLRKELEQWRDNFHKYTAHRAKQLRQFREFQQSPAGEHVLAFSS